MKFTPSAGVGGHCIPVDPSYLAFAARNSGSDATYKVKYRPETKGLMPIPETEIRLSNGVYTQNPGW